MLFVAPRVALLGAVSYVWGSTVNYSWDSLSEIQVLVLCTNEFTQSHRPVSLLNLFLVMSILYATTLSSWNALPCVWLSHRAVRISGVSFPTACLDKLTISRTSGVCKEQSERCYFGNSSRTEGLVFPRFAMCELSCCWCYHDNKRGVPFFKFCVLLCRPLPPLCFLLM